MDYLYTATETYAPGYDEGGFSWAKFIEFSKLTHLTELVSLDTMLNGSIVKQDNENPEDSKFSVVDNLYVTGLFNSLNYVVEQVKDKERFNLLKVVKEPDHKCEEIETKDFEFVGYELLDKDYSTSALANCGGFDETFQPSDLNQYGLIDTFEMAYYIRERLFANNPDEHHADCYVLAVWRHKEKGRVKDTNHYDSKQ